MTPPLFLVDGHNLLWRAWYGFPARITSRDKTRDLTGVFGFFALLRVAVRELDVPPEIVVVFDGENAWADRTAIDQDYKAHRPTDPEAMAPIRALADVERGLDLLGLPRLCLDTAEADDLIASLLSVCRQATPRREAWIMSGDRDFYQLLGRRTRILNTARKPGHRAIVEAELEDRYGVRPGQWCDRTSLVGDPSDGIRGVHGVGTVTAARLLAGGLTIDDLPSSGRLTGRIGDRVRDALPDALRWRSMIRLRTDQPTPDGLIDRRPAPPMPAAALVVEGLGLW
ncbi:5'-3' exonuclease H3TH domain-containing protein [Microlunatus sp. GCM10028923]|uniref:5'-3' exonuclease n=1 Tax=Microlunatus sp. GCM10028923 TaxID=3273400 RepID=UPI0036239F1B